MTSVLTAKSANRPHNEDRSVPDFLDERIPVVHEPSKHSDVETPSDVQSTGSGQQSASPMRYITTLENSPEWKKDWSYVPQANALISSKSVGQRGQVPVSMYPAPHDEQLYPGHAPQVSYDRPNDPTQPLPLCPPLQQTSEAPSWDALETYHLILFRGQTVKPTLHLNLEKGFFLSSDAVWTTYRRSYFVLSAAFIIDVTGIESYEQGDMTIIDGRTEKYIGEFTLKMTAEVADSRKKQIELIQHTPKRDERPQLTPTLLPVVPSRTYWNSPEGPSNIVQWKRVQFKSATANNGKRRAQLQQYFHLIVELLVNTADEHWNLTSICFARRRSEPLVVRGRSPSHYQNEGPHNAVSRSKVQLAPVNASFASRQKVVIEQEQHNFGGSNLHEDAAFVVDPAQAHTKSDQSRATTMRKDILTSQHPTPASQWGYLSPNLQTLANEFQRKEWTLAATSPEPQHDLTDHDDSSISSRGSPANSSIVRLSSTASSVSHMPQALDFVSEFARLQGVEKLCMDCLAVSTPERFERNFRRLLECFESKFNLGPEEEVEQKAARFIRKHSRTIASRITEMCRIKSSEPGSLPLSSIEPYTDFSMSRYLAEHDAVQSEPPHLSTTAAKSYVASDNDSDGELSIDSRDGPIVSSLAQDVQQGGAPVSDYLESLRYSDAIEDLREGLLDFRIALENTRYRNRLDMKQHIEAEVEPHAGSLRPQLSNTYSFWRRLKDSFMERFRPSLRSGYRRITWTCDCGEPLYADFDNTDSVAVDDLADSLGKHNSASNEPGSGDHDSTSMPERFPRGGESSNSGSQQPGGSIHRRATTMATSSSSTTAHNRIYKTLIELDVTNLKSDASLFAAMKREYRAARGYRAHFASLFKPISVEFVHFSLWNIRHGLISICDRPECVPPPSANEYEFIPKPLRPLPPMPPEIFIHYLEHGDGDLLPTRCDWLPRLPKRLDGRMIDKTDGPCYGWGIYIKEGPNRDTIFWMVILTVLGSVVLSICWSALRDDVQGGSGLGTLVLTLPTVVMGAFIFRFTNHD